MVLSSKSLSESHSISRRTFLKSILVGCGAAYLLKQQSWPQQQEKRQSQVENPDHTAIACLAIIARYWGRTISLKSARDIFESNRKKGVHPTADIVSILPVAKCMGFKTYTGLYLHRDSTPLEDQPGPWMACLERGKESWWVVVHNIKDNQAVVTDPRTGFQTVSWEDFKADWRTPIPLALYP